MPFTANRQFKAKPRLLGKASGMHYWTPDGRQILDAVAASAVRHRVAHLLDERRARRFDGDPGEHGSRRVSDHAGNRPLRERGRRAEHDAGDDQT